MNSTHLLPSATPFPPSRSVHAASASRQEALQTRFGRRVVSHLTEASQALPADIAERLRFAREQALLRARTARAEAQGPSPRGAAAPRPGVGGRMSGWRFRLATAIPVVALVGGLVLIQNWQDSTQIAAAAEIDAALLSDTLPPTAYSDAGFVEYLKTASE